MRFWRTTELKVLHAGDALRVAAALGRSPRAVQCKARRLGIPAPRMPHACYWPEATRRRAIEMRRRGLSLRAISEATGVPFGTLRHWVYGARSGRALGGGAE